MYKLEQGKKWRNTLVINKSDLGYWTVLNERNEEERLAIYGWSGIWDTAVKKGDKGLILHASMGDARVREWDVYTDISPDDLTEHEDRYIGEMLSTAYLVSRTYKVKRLIMGCDCRINAAQVCRQILDRYGETLEINIKKITLFPSYVGTNKLSSIRVR